MRADALGLPGPQRVALGRLDLDHVGAEVAEHLREDVAGKEAREVEDAHLVQGAATLGFVIALVKFRRGHVSVHPRRGPDRVDRREPRWRGR